ncbi:Anaerobic dimethyl sulfoxide reductase chain B [uncultured Desulfobacterium sp.]|uniref:Anaerobic dimethyl sulfoxide reductase chain B n=1 Tax=uncultured Desulfobacterium sp. TaxID=201089 RepID=A0A445N0F2_9BACT|nr:Anaerobic dimethyl sulfoxide reductase chain B [uncultured Desulfobacterium sp.]
MQLGFYFDQTRCVGCYTCCVACKDWHDIQAGSAHWIRVNELEEGRFPNVSVSYLMSACYHCEDPPCMKDCPVEAINKRETDGVVVVDRDVCLGESACGACKDACPYGAPQFGGGKDDRMQKCDLCLERWEEGRKPICVGACPTRALDVGPMDKLKEKYGLTIQAKGFTFARQARPSIIFKKKNP